MLPIRDHNPSYRIPYVTYGLMVLNILVWLSYGFSDLHVQHALYLEWGLQPFEIVYGVAWETLISSMFLHGGILHLAGNMLFLYIFGDNLEDYLGHFGFLCFYILGGLGAHFLQIWMNPYSAVPLIGASGAIAAVMGGYLLLFPKARIDILLFLVVYIRLIPVPAWGTLLFWFAIQVFNGIRDQSGMGGVAHWAHAGGFVAGVLLIALVWLIRGRPRAWPNLSNMQKNIGQNNKDS